MKQPTKNFTQVPNEVFKFYTRIPEFKLEHTALYAVLRDLYNVKEGCAFPTVKFLALETGSSTDRIAKMLPVLERSGLITTIHRINHTGNNRYVVHDPITNLDDFYKEFPEAKIAYDKQYSKLKERNDDDKARLKQFYENEQPQEGIKEVTRQLTGNEITVKATDNTPQAIVNGVAVSMDDIVW